MILNILLLSTKLDSKCNTFKTIGYAKIIRLVRILIIMEVKFLYSLIVVMHVSIFSQLFEGMKAYRGVDGKIRLFRPELNMERMNNSAVRAGLPPFRGEELIKCICRLISIDQEWVPHSTASSLYIRPTLIGIDVSIILLLRICHQVTPC